MAPLGLPVMVRVVIAFERRDWLRLLKGAGERERENDRDEDSAKLGGVHVTAYWIGWGYLVCLLVTWYVAAGLVFANLQGVWPEKAAKYQRVDFACAIIVGLLFALVWPVGFPIVWAISRQGKHGFW